MWLNFEGYIVEISKLGSSPFFFLSWSIVALQRVNFCGIAK